MGFDFVTNLASHFSVPTHQISVRQLTGGYSNEVVRATFSPPIDLSRLGFTDPITSMIVKYAPPHYANDASQPLEVHRQVVEAQALALLDPKSNDPLPASALFKKHPVKMPYLIHHDTNAYVLSMTDLGQAVQLNEWLDGTPGPTMHEVRRIGMNLGKFFAEFYVSTSNPTPETLVRANNDLVIGGWHAQFMDFAKEAIAKQDIPDADILIKRVQRCFSQFGKLETCLGPVDLWAGNILIDPSGCPGLIDWEYFGLSSPSFELATFISSLFRIILQKGTREDGHLPTLKFIRAFLCSYSEFAPPPSTTFKHQTLIVLGSAMLNHVLWQPEELADGMLQRAIKSGLGCIRAAGDLETDIDKSWLLEAHGAYERLFERVVVMIIE